MKVKIISCSINNDCWYSDKVGQVIEVFKTDDDYYIPIKDKNNYDNYRPYRRLPSFDIEECNCMEFIKLTDITDDGIRIRPKDICNYIGNKSDERTEILTYNDERYYVKETVEEIDKLLGVE